MINRVFTAFSPLTVEKKSDGIRFGILGAASIALVFLGLCYLQYNIDD